MSLSSPGADRGLVAQLVVIRDTAVHRGMHTTHSRARAANPCDRSYPRRTRSPRRSTREDRRTGHSSTARWVFLTAKIMRTQNPVTNRPTRAKMGSAISGPSKITSRFIVLSEGACRTPKPFRTPRNAGRHPCHLRYHRRPGEGDDVPFALPPRGARSARLPDRRRRGGRLDSR